MSFEAGGGGCLECQQAHLDHQTKTNCNLVLAQMSNVLKAAKVTITVAFTVLCAQYIHSFVIIDTLMANKLNNIPGLGSAGKNLHG